VPVSQFKTIIPVAGALLFIQGIAQVFRCIICIRTGKWPPHTEDVEEMETMLLHQQMDDEEIKKELGLAKGESR
jgi:hypothetical protein